MEIRTESFCPHCTRIRNLVEYGPGKRKDPQLKDYVRIADSRIDALQILLRKCKHDRVEPDNQTPTRLLEAQLSHCCQEKAKLQYLLEQCQEGGGGEPAQARPPAPPQRSTQFGHTQERSQVSKFQRVRSRKGAGGEPPLSRQRLGQRELDKFPETYLADDLEMAIRADYLPQHSKKGLKHKVASRDQVEPASLPQDKETWANDSRQNLGKRNRADPLAQDVEIGPRAGFLSEHLERGSRADSLPRNLGTPRATSSSEDLEERGTRASSLQPQNLTSGRADPLPRNIDRERGARADPLQPQNMASGRPDPDPEPPRNMERERGPRSSYPPQPQNRAIERGESDPPSQNVERERRPRADPLQTQNTIGRGRSDPPSQNIERERGPRADPLQPKSRALGRGGRDSLSQNIESERGSRADPRQQQNRTSGRADPLQYNPPNMASDSDSDPLRQNRETERGHRADPSQPQNMFPPAAAGPVRQNIVTQRGHRADPSQPQILVPPGAASPLRPQNIEIQRGHRADPSPPQNVVPPAPADSLRQTIETQRGHRRADPSQPQNMMPPGPAGPLRQNLDTEREQRADLRQSQNITSTPTIPPPQNLETERGSRPDRQDLTSDPLPYDIDSERGHRADPPPSRQNMAAGPLPQHLETERGSRTDRQYLTSDSLHYDLERVRGHGGADPRQPLNLASEPVGSLPQHIETEMESRSDRQYVASDPLPYNTGRERGHGADPLQPQILVSGPASPLRHNIQREPGHGADPPPQPRNLAPGQADTSQRIMETERGLRADPPQAQNLTSGILLQRIETGSRADHFRQQGVGAGSVADYLPRILETKGEGELRAKIQRYVEEVRRIEELLQWKEEENQSLLGQYTALRQDFSDLETAQMTLERESDTARTTVRARAEENQLLKSQLADQASLVRSYEKQIEGLTNRVSGLETKLASVTHAGRSYESDTKLLESSCLTLEGKVDALRLDLANCQSHSKLLEGENGDLRLRTAELEKFLNLENESLSSLQEIIATYRETKELQEEKIRQLEEEKDLLEGQVITLMDRNEKLHTEIGHWRLKFVEATAELDGIRRLFENEKLERVAALEELKTLRHHLSTSSASLLINSALYSRGSNSATSLSTGRSLPSERNERDSTAHVQPPQDPKHGSTQ